MSDHPDALEGQGRTKPPIRVLYIEDNPMDVGLTERALRRALPDLRLDVVGTLALAMARLSPEAPPYDVILADLRLPDGNGFDVLAHVRGRNLPLPVIVLTASGDQATALAAIKAGADDYIPKRGDYTERLAPSLTAAIVRHRPPVDNGRALRVLYAEPKPFDVDLTRRHLARHAPHIQLEIVGSGEEVLECLSASADERCPFDALLLDYRLKGVDALEVVRMIRVERGLDVPVVLVTGQGDEDLVTAALRLGVTDYLDKSSGYLERLPTVIENVHQRALRQREQERERALANRFREVLAASPAIVYTLRKEGEQFRVTWVSENITRLLGYAVADCLEPEWWSRNVHSGDRERVIAQLPGLLASGSGVLEYRFYDETGTPRWIRDQLRCLASAPDAPVVELIGSWNDITAEHDAHERLKLYGVALESSREAVVITDLQPRILAVNPAFTRLTGYTEEEALGQNPNIQRSGRHDATFFKNMWECIRSEGFWEGEVWNRRKNGEVFPQRLSIHTVRDADGQATHYVAIASDLSQLKHSEEKLWHLAHYDILTELPNRVLLELRLEHSLDRARRSGFGVAVLVIDLDRFKTINDSLGHAAGDAMLQAAATRLRGRLRSEDTLARLAGDQFVLVMEGIADFRDAERMARDVQQLMETPFALPGEREAYVTASIGLSICPNDGSSARELLDKANTAVHRAKELGSGQIGFYTGELNTQALLNLELETALRRALDRREFILHYQPKVDLHTGHIIGAEALLRWERPGHGLVSPLQFIPLAERSGLIIPIGAWVIDEVCRQMRAWADAGVSEMSVALNVSARQFRGGDLETVLSDAIARHGVRPQRVVLELTESMLMERPEEAVERLFALKKLGVQLSLDDFGTGYSSLGYLSRFPIDQLKIDRSFVTNIVSDPSSAIIATSVIGLAHRMGIEVVAEGVETEPQLGYLRKYRCDQIQGYLFSRPVPADDFSTQLREEKSLALAAPTAETRTLLAVDDEANILSALRRLLRGEGYRILTATSAREALEILAREPVHVVLSDQRMPEMNGTDFLGRVKVLHPETVRIVLSGYTELESIMRAVNTGAIYKFLTKPWDDHVLREHLRDAFKYQEAVLQPRATAQTPPDAPT